MATGTLNIAKEKQRVKYKDAQAILHMTQPDVKMKILFQPNVSPMLEGEMEIQERVKGFHSS